MDRPKRKWIIIYFDSDGEVYGPIWEIESKIKPTRWASHHLPEYFPASKVREVEAFSENGYSDAFVKAL